ncbi:MAG: urease accessory UreF family protein [Pseudomonadota bacterium]
MATGAPTAMSMDIPLMRIEIDLITLTQWLSPSFPIGSFAYSHGLEAAVARGWVQNAGSLQEWLSDIALHGTGRSDAIWLRLAYRAEDRTELLALNAEARAFAPAKTRLIEAERQGAAFAKTVRAVWEMDLPDLLVPLAVGAATHQKDIDIDLVVPLYLQAVLGNLVSAAQRLMPLGQTEGQAVLAALQQACLQIAQETADAEREDIYSNAFASDIAAMHHETLEPRLFQS